MAHSVALIGLVEHDNLGIGYLASSLTAAGFDVAPLAVVLPGNGFSP